MARHPKPTAFDSSDLAPVHEPAPLPPADHDPDIEITDSDPVETESQPTQPLDSDPVETESQPTQPLVADTRDARCAANYNHVPGCGCTGALRGPMPARIING